MPDLNAPQTHSGIWKVCLRGSCHRNERCMYTQCKPNTMSVDHADTKWPSEVVEIANRRWTIEQIELYGVVYYGCGILPLRNRREDLIEDIRRSQGPEWRV